VQDVSLLLDLCRQSIIFEDIKDLCSCLVAIEKDADVVVIQVAFKKFQRVQSPQMKPQDAISALNDSVKHFGRLY